MTFSKNLTWCVVSVTTVIAFIQFNYFQVDFISAFSTVALGMIVKILSEWIFIMINPDKAMKVLHSKEMKFGN